MQVEEGDPDHGAAELSVRMEGAAVEPRKSGDPERHRNSSEREERLERYTKYCFSCLSKLSACV